MPFDLYGNYYASDRDAMNAEMAQCAAIDASIATRDLRRAQENEYYESQRRAEWERGIDERLSALEKAVSGIQKQEPHP